MPDYNVALDTERSRRARERLESRFTIGREAQTRLVKQVEALTIRDRMVWPEAMVFDSLKSRPHVFVANMKQLAKDHPSPVPAAPFAAIPESALTEEAMSRPAIRVHPHALGQMVKAVQDERKKRSRARSAGEPEKCGPNVKYIRSLGAATDLWEKELFRDTMNSHFREGEFLDRRKSPTQFLFRLVGPDDNLELRGFVSRNFNIFLPSYPLLRAFMESCEQMQAQPVEAMTTDVRFRLKCCLPYVFEPVPGTFVTIGKEWTNSDFGAGRLTLQGCLMEANTGRVAVLEKGLSKTHLGSLIEETDLELSEEAMLAAVKAQCLAIRDVVRAQLEPDAVNKILLAVKAAHEEQVPWVRLERELGALLRKKEVQDVHDLLVSGTSDIEDLPQPAFMKDDAGNPVPVATRWWASNVVSWLSTKETDTERRADLQSLAGSLLSK